MWAGHLEAPYTLKKVVSNLMQAPLYPVTLDIFQAQVEFTEFTAGDDAALRRRSRCARRRSTIPTAPPATASSMAASRSATSPTPSTAPGERDKTIVELCRGADIMIYDSSYTDAEYERYKGWGHSTWQEGVRLADAAGVGTLAIFHHDPSHDDAFMDGVAREAAALRPGTVAGGLPRVIVAHEGLTLAP